MPRKPKTDFTPGPWKHYNDKLRPQFSTVIHEVQDANGQAVVSWGGFDGMDRPDEEIAANARLIAASPRLFKALETVVRQIEGGHPVGHDAFLAARSAINSVR